jgi:hypothetical protein
MKKVIFYFMLLPFTCLGQTNITGRVINKTDKMPISHASVFLNNATIGAQTDNKGNFTLGNVKSGSYELVVSIVGYNAYHKNITVNDSPVTLPKIELTAKTISLQQVTIKPVDDPYRSKYLDQFETEFLGKSQLADECKIINPEMLDFIFDENTNKLTASSVDFLIIDNKALGYRLKYLLTDFVNERKDSRSLKTHYEGSVLFEEMKGTDDQKKQWQQKRREVYDNSSMHFFRATIANRVQEEGFKVLQYANEPSSKKQSDELIATKLKYFNNLKAQSYNGYADSLKYWKAQSLLPKTSKILRDFPLTQQDILKLTDQPNMYVLNCENDGLYVTYNKTLRFSKNVRLNNINDADNTETTLIKFDEPNALIDNNGSLADLNSLSYSGAWGRYRMAGLLPVDYEDPNYVKQGRQTPNAAAMPIAKLKDYAEQHIIEKAYLHFDKPYYAAGDTAFFKAYITQGDDHQLSNESGVLHVDLINPDNKIGKALLLQIKDGVAWGDFELPDSLTKGDYNVRAYTNLMRNDGSDVFFERVIPIVSLLEAKTPESGSKAKTLQNVKADIQFFPEGGELVTGINNKVAFKAVGTNGMGVDVKGAIIDDSNNEVVKLQSTHMGMGYCYLTPKTGKTYKAMITFADGSQKLVHLPDAQNDGLIFSVNNDSIPKATAYIAASPAYFAANKDKEYSILIYSGGVATTIPFKLEKSTCIVNILKRHLHTGVATVTLFSPKSEPISERLIFVQNYDQLSIGVTSDKQTYQPKEAINIALNVKNRADEASKGHFSVSVVDMSKVPVDENAESTIMANMLLTSDLKGYIEQPNYYFNHINEETTANLDLVMLTHGYRRFAWKPLLDNAYPPLTYESEKALEINGTAKSPFGKPIAGGTVSLISRDASNVLSQTTANDGSFSFKNLIFSDTTKFILQAVNSKGNNNTILTYQPYAHPAITIIPANSSNETKQALVQYVETNKKQLERNLRLDRRRIELQQVNIKATRRTDNYPSSSLSGPGHADQVIHHKDFENLEGRLLPQILGQMLHGRALKILVNKGLLLMDGVEISSEVLQGITSREVETIEALYGPDAAIYGMRAGNGVLIITSTNRITPPEITSTGILPIAVNGFYRAREFYMPKYDHAGISNLEPDLRSTIFWKPEINTDNDGHASLSYYNADGPGNYRMVIEGIDENGNIGRKVFNYAVK